MIHTKGLEIVRDIYAEIYKTADYRERMEIEKYAIKSESTRQRENFVRAARYILALNAAVDGLDRDPWLLNVENGMIDERSECRGRACTDMTERVRNRRAKPEPPKAVLFFVEICLVLCDIYYENAKNGFRRAYRGLKVK